MGLLIVFKEEHEVACLSGFGLFGDQVLALGRGIALKKADQLVTYRVVIIILLEQHLKSVLDHFLDSLLVDADDVDEGFHALLAQELY
jgi:hypothetical protein